MARNIEAFSYDLLLNVNTMHSMRFSGKYGFFKDSHHYEPPAHSTIKGIIKLIKPSFQDTVYVLGSGKGRSAFHFARLRIKKVVGIEISDELYEISKNNAERVRGLKSPIVFLMSDVVDVDFGDGTIFFMFNPFGEKTLSTVLNKIESICKNSKQRILIIYVHPTYSYILDQKSWLSKIHDFKRLSGQHIKIYSSDNLHPPK